MTVTRGVCVCVMTVAKDVYEGCYKRCDDYSKRCGDCYK